MGHDIDDVVAVKSAVVATGESAKLVTVVKYKTLI